MFAFRKISAKMYESSCREPIGQELFGREAMIGAVTISL